MMVEQDLIKKITAEVLAKMQAVSQEDGKGDSGVFETVDEAVNAARVAYERLKTMSREEREKIVQAIRDATDDNAEIMAKMAVEESGMGRVSDKVIKNRLAARKTPGTEDLTPEAWTGEDRKSVV
jgi:propionaldehyde dehydrogenase